jgi:hypothetical protein
MMPRPSTPTFFRVRLDISSLLPGFSRFYRRPLKITANPQRRNAEIRQSAEARNYAFGCRKRISSP